MKSVSKSACLCKALSNTIKLNLREKSQLKSLYEFEVYRLGHLKSL